MSANQFRLCAKRSEDSIRSLPLFAANKNEKTRQLAGRPRLPRRPPRHRQRDREPQRLRQPQQVERRLRAP
jgi:hypothetical protein